MSIASKFRIFLLKSTLHFARENGISSCRQGGQLDKNINWNVTKWYIRNQFERRKLWCFKRSQHQWKITILHPLFFVAHSQRCSNLLVPASVDRLKHQVLASWLSNSLLWQCQTREIVFTSTFHHFCVENLIHVARENAGIMRQRQTSRLAQVPIAQVRKKNIGRKLKLQREQQMRA